MKLIRPRLIGDIDDSLPAAIRRRRRTRLHLELIDRIHRRKEDQHAGIGIHAVDAVDKIGHVLDRRAIDHGAVGAAATGVAEHSRCAADAGQHAGRELDELREVARVQREVDDLLGLLHLPDVRRLRLDCWRRWPRQ